MVIAGGYLYFSATKIDDGTSRLGQCASGTCVLSLFSPPAAPTAMAGDATWLYVAASGTIYRVSHALDKPTTFVSPTGATIKPMALTQSYLFYVKTTGGTPAMQRCALYTSPCLPGPATYPKAASAITAANDTLYWAYGSTIERCAADAGCVTQSYVVDGGQSAASRIVADSRGVYWGGQQVHACLSTSGCAQSAVRHFVPAGSTPGTVVSMVSIGSDLVWTYAAAGTGSLQRVTATP
jgi:hypothetical protein